MTEQWLPVPGWGGIYAVSDCGRVRSADRTTQCRNGYPRRVAGRILKPFPRPSGHLLVDLVDGSRRERARSVHRLVLAAFVGPCPDGMEGLHWDDDPTNNLLSNLRYGTRSENEFDKIRNGRHHQANKTHCPQGHEYTPENIIVGSTGGRNCRQCTRACQRRYDAKRRSA